MELTIELVPSTAWFKNLRSELPKGEWDKIRHKCYADAGHKCEICGDIGPKWPVECHEIWDYDDENKVQTLKGVIALCPDCHQVKHAGLAGIRGKSEEVIAQLCRVNKILPDVARHHVRAAMEKYRERSQHQWEIDLSWLEKRESS